jgi:hypothetical protein
MSNRALGAVPKVVNFIQILFCNGCMVTLTEAPAQSGRPSIQLFDRSPSGQPQLLAPEIVERKGLPKEIIMQMPAILEGESLTRLCQGAAAGAVATMVIGFAWGGWTLGSTAKADATKAAASALVAVLAPICADKFKQAADAPANMAELKKVSTWQQDSYIEKGGWATFPGMSTPDRSVAQACANLLTAL